MVHLYRLEKLSRWLFQEGLSSVLRILQEYQLIFWEWVTFFFCERRVSSHSLENKLLIVRVNLANNNLLRNQRPVLERKMHFDIARCDRNYSQNQSLPSVTRELYFTVDKNGSDTRGTKTSTKPNDSPKLITKREALTLIACSSQWQTLEKSIAINTNCNAMVGSSRLLINLPLKIAVCYSVLLLGISGLAAREGIPPDQYNFPYLARRRRRQTLFFDNKCISPLIFGACGALPLLFPSISL